MSTTRKQRREQAAKAARTVKPVADVKPQDTAALELRSAYRQVEELEAENSALYTSLRTAHKDYADLDQKAYDKIGKLEKYSYWSFIGGVLFGAILGGFAW